MKKVEIYIEPTLEAEYETPDLECPDNNRTKRWTGEVPADGQNFKLRISDDVGTDVRVYPSGKIATDNPELVLVQRRIPIRREGGWSRIDTNRVFPNSDGQFQMGDPDWFVVTLDWQAISGADPRMSHLQLRRGRHKNLIFDLEQICGLRWPVRLY